MDKPEPQRMKDERNMSETPICDNHKYETDQGAEVVPLEIAQKLERMLKNAEKAAETYRLEAQKAKHEQSAKMLESERAANAKLTEELAEARELRMQRRIKRLKGKLNV